MLRLSALLVASALLVPSSQPPQRIISLVPAATQMLFAMGAGAQVVGVSSFDDYPPEVRTLTRVGALLDPDLERILSLRPDLVVVYGSQADLRTKLSTAGIADYAYTHAGLADVTTTIRSLGERVGHAAESQALAARIEQDLAAIRQRAATRPHPRTLLVFGRESGSLRSIYASGGVGFLHDMLTTAGGVNVFADVKRESVQATTEQILARKPDLILEIRPDSAGLKSLDEERAAWARLASVPAVRDKRIVFLIDPRLVIAGPRVAEATKLMEEAIAGR